jgi:hypothetical protein
MQPPRQSFVANLLSACRLESSGLVGVLVHAVILPRGDGKSDDLADSLRRGRMPVGPLLVIKEERCRGRLERNLLGKSLAIRTETGCRASGLSGSQLPA